MWRLDATVPDRDKKHPPTFFSPLPCFFTFYFILDDPLILKRTNVRLHLTLRRYLYVAVVFIIFSYAIVVFFTYIQVYALRKRNSKDRENNENDGYE